LKTPDGSATAAVVPFGTIRAELSVHCTEVTLLVNSVFSSSVPALQFSHLEMAVAFVQLHSRLYLTLKPRDEAEVLAHTVCNQHFILIPLCCTPDDQRESYTITTQLQMTLADIYLFNVRVNTIERQQDQKKLVLYSGYDIDDQVNGSFLLGCYLMLIHQCDYDYVMQAFRNFDHLFHLPRMSSQVKLVDGWQAVNHARTLGWITALDVQHLAKCGSEESPIDLEEYLHYAR
jgi:hypothetical protein